ncbi:HopJ type III effector protein [Cellulophaga tyrosinoxydans]|uniref:HopJ type III effector protein n=1 Tax=Cellulophaga tyrosinoxydans TaxID=504486 RepID=A0A1W1YY92_9FLAO|nr:HopJ type III effector protein [Cellulophaga tyrosinoxydans]SMC41104.1 HopJ type III effector protein [Cellulophaga tyrosinoxydans]
MKLQDLKNKLNKAPETVNFTDTMAVIEANYIFTPTAFTNGELKNAAGENSGSCKLFAFAKKQNFTKEETLACFGAYYFEEVLKNPEGSNHQNIRNFIKTGFAGLKFEAEALLEK